MSLSRRLLSDGGDLITRSDITQLNSHVVVILVSLLCALICVVGLGLVARCALIRRRVSSQNPPMLPPKKGLKKKVLQSIPKLSFTPSILSDHDVGDETALECPICLAEFVEGVEIRVLPQCRHVFHVQCVDTWFRSHSSCPYFGASFCGFRLWRDVPLEDRVHVIGIPGGDPSLFSLFFDNPSEISTVEKTVEDLKEERNVRELFSVKQ